MDESPSEAIFRGNAGVALKSEGVTWAALIASLSYALIVHLVQVATFIIVRPRLPRV